MSCLNKKTCCPPAQIMKEKICGNFVGSVGIPPIVWQAPAGDYIQGNFQIFNSAASTGPTSGNVQLANGSAIAFGPTPGNTSSVTTSNPINFRIFADIGESGTYCITLYKRVLA